MDVRAIILLGPATLPNAPESLGGVPIALLDVLGRPMLHRVLDRLQRYGISGVTVIGDAGPNATRFLARALRPDFEWVAPSGQALWHAAQRVFAEKAQDGSDVIIAIRLGPYAELDYEQLLQFHLDQNSRVTAVTDGAGELLGTFVISASRRNDAAYLLRHRLKEFRTPLVRYPFAGYVNRLAGAADFRRLAVDAFCGRVQITPQGRQVRPGIWIAEGARVHRGARILAPAFIGEHAKLRASAVVTRCGVLEHHTEVDCGTVVEDSTVLPYTVVGAGLDVSHSVVGFGRIAHLHRQVEVEVEDPKLVGSVVAAPLRALGQAASLATYLPFNFIRGLFGRPAPEPGLPAAVQAPSAALKAAESLPGDPALSNFR